MVADPDDDEVADGVRRHWVVLVVLGVGVHLELGRRSATPALEKRRANTLYIEPSWRLLFQATTKPPPALTATDGRLCVSAV